ncbi:MAG TPA: hypothetical protein VGP35_00685 [Terriglobales bacterium]|nr:hypothetical protein [Terriglobales bacterium]
MKRLILTAAAVLCSTMNLWAQAAGSSPVRLMPASAKSHHHHNKQHNPRHHAHHHTGISARR